MRKSHRSQHLELVKNLLRQFKFVDSNTTISARLPLEDPFILTSKHAHALQWERKKSDKERRKRNKEESKNNEIRKEINTKEGRINNVGKILRKRGSEMR